MNGGRGPGIAYDQVHCSRAPGAHEWVGAHCPPCSIVLTLIAESQTKIETPPLLAPPTDFVL